MMVIFYSVSVAHGNTLTTVLNPVSTTTTDSLDMTTTVTTTVTSTDTGGSAGMQTSTLCGYVKGSGGLPIPDAFVYLHAGSLLYHTQASSSGYYQFSADRNIPSGVYQIRASTDYPEEVGTMSELATLVLISGNNGYDIQYANYPPVTTITTTVTTTTVVTTTPGTPMASIYVNVCSIENYANRGISFEKTGNNGTWLPMMATGLTLSGNLSAPTRLNITQFENLGYPDVIILKLAGTSLDCHIDLQLNAMLEINMCTCQIDWEPQYDY